MTTTIQPPTALIAAHSLSVARPTLTIPGTIGSDVRVGFGVLMPRRTVCPPSPTPAVPHHVSQVSGVRIPPEIPNAVMGGVIIPMAGFHPIGAWADERQQHQPVNGSRELVSASVGQMHIDTTVTDGVRRQQSPALAKHAPMAGHLVTGEVWDQTPDFRGGT